MGLFSDAFESCVNPIAAITVLLSADLQMIRETLHANEHLGATIVYASRYYQLDNALFLNAGNWKDKVKTIIQI